MKYHDIARLQRTRPHLVADSSKNPQRKSGQFDFPAAAIFIKKWLRLPGIGHAEFRAALLPGGETRGHKPAFDAAFANYLVHLAQQFRWLQLLRRKAAHDTDRHGAV